MTKKAIRFVQARLNHKGLDAGPEDGILGPRTLAALDRVEEIPRSWSKERKLVAFVQLTARDMEIETGPVDGYWGPQTEYAFDVIQEVSEGSGEPRIWRPEELPDDNPLDWPTQRPEREISRFYGNVGKHQTRIDLPYSHKLAWNTRKTVHSFTCHEKVHDSLLRVLGRVLDHYGQEEISRLRLDLWGGCLNVRKMRGGTRYSMHSWGIAVDYDPTRNRLKWGRDRAVFATPDYDVWWRLWEEEGWTSLGRARNFDWMHIQAARL